MINNELTPVVSVGNGQEAVVVFSDQNHTADTVVGQPASEDRVSLEDPRAAVGMGLIVGGIVIAAYAKNWLDHSSRSQN